MQEKINQARENRATIIKQHGNDLRVIIKERLGKCIQDQVYDNGVLVHREAKGEAYKDAMAYLDKVGLGKEVLVVKAILQECLGS